MATFSQKSLRPKPFLLLIVTFVIFYATSCKQDHAGKGEWIPIPPDTSALGKIDHFIPLDNIRKYQQQFSTDKDSLAKCMSYLNFSYSEAFNKPALLEVLKNPKCVGIRIYYGVNKVDSQSGFRVMIVGVDEQGKDLYITRGSPIATQGDGGKDGGLEYGQCIPPCTP